MRKSGLLGSSALRSAAIVALSLSVCTPALAQDAAIAEDDAAAQPEQDDPVASSGDVATVDQAPQEEDREPEAIVITGSRIARNETTSASPLLIIDPEIAQRQGRLDTAEMIQNSSIAQGSTQITSALSINSVANGGPGAQTVSLRGLGSARTLVLLNSRRAGPAGTRGSISSFDLNVLPQSIIRQVDILKDGASSIYGSDAIAGVVNLITKRDTDGIELSGFSSVPTAGGAETYNASVAYGKDFGRGHVMLAADIYRRNELERQDREYLDCPELYLLRPDGVGRADIIDPRTGKYQCANGVTWGHIWAYGVGNLPDPSLTLIQYTYGDNLGQYIPPAAAPTKPNHLLVPPGWFPVSYGSNVAAESVTNYYHPFEQKSSVSPATDRYSLYGDASFELSDAIELYAEGLFNRRKTFEDSLTQFYNFGYTNLYAPGDKDDPFPDFKNPLGGHSFISPTGILDDYDREYTVNYYRGVAGVRGEIGNNWRWDVYGQYSLSDGKYQLQQVLNDVITQQTDRAYGYGCAGLFTPISNRPCLQMNWTDPRVMAGYLTDAEKAYLLDTETGRTEYKQKFAEASISGNLFELPAGPLGIAVGAVIRKDQIDDTPGHITRALKPGGNANNEADYVNNAFSNDFASGHTFGHSITKEAFGEVNVPILKNSPIARSLTFSAAARVTNVKAVRGGDGFTDESKNNWTYKLLGNWQIHDWVRLRATYGTSYRAPALFEQFLAAQSSGALQSIDPCVRWQQKLANGQITQVAANNCQAEGIPPGHTGGGIQISVFSSGGIGLLEPETSRSKTASIIFTPRLASLPDTELDVVVDYFNIKVKGEIARLTASDIVKGCYNSENYPDEPLCDLFVRGQDGNPFNIKNVFSKYINIDQQVNSGFDFTVRFRQKLGGFGRLSILGQATLQERDEVIRLGKLESYNGEVGDPKFTGELNTSLDLTDTDTTLFWGMNVIGKASSAEDFIRLNNPTKGSLCNISTLGVATYGEYCYAPYVPTVFYHNFSISQRVMDDRFQFTLGITNAFNRAPPRVSGVSTLGNVPLFATQYDWFGRRVFVNAKARF